MWQVNVKLDWRGQKIEALLLSGIKRGIATAIERYRKEIVKVLSEHWGSVPAFGFFRIRKVHSKPGQAPFMQTGNLAGSVRTSAVTRIATNTYSAKCGTTVPYARTLELGGVAWPFPQKMKRFTIWRLVNHIRRAYIIAARPAWMPVFFRLRTDMVNDVADEIRKSLVRSP